VKPGEEVITAVQAAGEDRQAARLEATLSRIRPPDDHA
jgi:hypothetical protein